MIAKKLREEMANDEYYQKCSRKELLNDHVCSGRITWEHAMYYAGRKIQEKWAIIPLCELAHSVNKFQDSGILNKEVNRWIALNRASDKELKEYPRSNFIQERTYLNGKFKSLQKL